MKGVLWVIFVIGRTGSRDFGIAAMNYKAVSAISEARLPVPASTYSSSQVVQICAGTFRMTMVVSPRVSVTVVVPGSVSPYWQMTHFMSVSSWSSDPVPTYRWSARKYTIEKRSIIFPYLLGCCSSRSSAKKEDASIRLESQSRHFHRCLLVAHTGFEPVISALRGRCPRPLDECASGACLPLQ
jgi:hypothetical protein